MRKVILALAMAGLLLAQPASVSATAYSSVVFKSTWTPVNGIFGVLCVQAGEVDTNRNYGQVWSRYYNGGNNCSGGAQTVGTSVLGISVDGYRDGAYCGSSGWYYNSQSAWGWQLWITLCANPAGVQAFTTAAYCKGYQGYPTGNWWDPQDWQACGSSVMSPAQNY